MIEVKLNPVVVQRNEYVIEEWVKKNTKTSKHQRLSGSPSIFRMEFHTWWFGDEAEAILFKLRWG